MVDIWASRLVYRVSGILDPGLFVYTYSSIDGIIQGLCDIIHLSLKTRTRSLIRESGNTTEIMNFDVVLLVL
jgi:hypothetical protein